jgi:predicted KAP-like P-loop ATPase
MAQATTDFFGDEPLENPADDALGYAPFTAKVAEALISLKPKSGLVLALYGSWGGGKSTMLNFVAKNLDSRPKDEQPIIIRFNPWWFSGQETLVLNFFTELIAGLRLNSLTDTALKNLPRLLRILGAGVSIIPTMEPVGAVVGKLGKEFDEIGRDTLSKVRAEIENKLKQFPSPILVIIDDLDRLPDDEIR